MTKRTTQVALSSTATSIKARLANLARSNGQEFNHVLTRYSLERFLFRLVAVSQDFILKGAALYHLSQQWAPRPTKDLDLLRRKPASIPDLEEIVRQACCVPCPDDGTIFDPESVVGEFIREEMGAVAGGVRINLKGNLGQAILSVQLDIGFGEAMVPPPFEAEYPCLLPGMPAAKILAYRWETSIAEKVEAMVKHDVANSRMKDFFDIWELSNTMVFVASDLRKAIAATFVECRRPLPKALPFGLTDEFATMPEKQAQWSGWRWRFKPIDVPENLQGVICRVRDFLGPILLDELPPVARWNPSGGWEIRKNS